jgi:uncharacterized LabA/DUF88 family protein
MGVLVSSAPTPHYKKLMVFVDGTNFLSGLSREMDIIINPDKADALTSTSISLAKTLIELTINRSKGAHGFSHIRYYWFGSYKGGQSDEFHYYKTLREQGFEPFLYRKVNDKEKGVDIALTKEMLVNAFNANFDVAILFAGDADYVDLVKEIKRYGPIVMGAYFQQGLSEVLQYAFDFFIIISKDFLTDKLPEWEEKLKRCTQR